MKSSRLSLALIAILGLLIVAGCRSEKAPQRQALRCIYDQAAFRNLCQKAINDEACFNTFKSDVFYALLWQGYSYKEGEQSLQVIEERYPFLLGHLDAFRTSDLIGSPRTYDYGKHGVFSPTTLHHICTMGSLIDQFGELSSLHIVQIGAGYGGLCTIIHDAASWKSYTLIDLPEHLALARKVLERQGIFNVHYLTLNELPPDAHYDLAISDLSFSEYSRPLQQLLIDKILLQSDRGYLQCHVFPKHFGVIPFNPYQLKEYFEKKQASPHLLWDEPQGLRSNYYLFWSKCLI